MTLAEAASVMGLARKHPASDPVAVYLHIPFCRSICAFCIFRSVIAPAPRIAQYVQALRKEIALYGGTEYAASSSVGSVYLGGGTPSLLTAESLAGLLTTLRAFLRFADGAEVTVEASPSSVDAAKLTAWRAAGANRLSFGVQTLSDRLGGVLGLPQRSGEALDALRLARGAGFDNVDIDLLYNIPTQSMEEWRDTLDRALEAGPEQMSLYPLNPAPHSLMARMIEMGQLPPPGPVTLEVDMYWAAKSLLESAGYVQYAPTNFTRLPPERRHGVLSRHCAEGGLLALGACAHGRLNNYRYRNLKDVGDYLHALAAGRLPVGSGQSLSRGESLSAHFTAAIRVGVVDIRQFRERFGLAPAEAFPDSLDRCIQKGLIRLAEGGLSLTEEGRLWWKGVQSEFRSDPPAG